MVCHGTVNIKIKPISEQQRKQRGPALTIKPQGQQCEGQELPNDLWMILERQNEFTRFCIEEIKKKCPRNS